jgi:hypothetical protein
MKANRFLKSTETPKGVHMRIVTTARRLPALLALALTAGCGTVTAVRALRKGESAVAVSAGGPVAHLVGMNMPFPYAVARYRYGLNDQTGLYVGGHISAAGLGIVGMDGGVSHHFLKQSRGVPAVGASAGLLAMVKPGDGQVVFPQVDVVASYLLGDRLLAYFGGQSMYQLHAKPYVVIAPFAGAETRLGRSFSFSLEAKWYAPFEKTKPRNVDYRLPIGGKGAVGFVLGVNYHFGGWYE